MLTAVIMAGGKGERFWPKSRTKLPKQLLSLTGDGKTMIQLTVERLKGIIEYDNIYIVTSSDCADAISYQLPQIPTENILVEPMGRNTAPCIGLAAAYIQKKKGTSTMIVLPSDHLIKDVEGFCNILLAAKEVAESGKNLVTIGITPTYPETGYGYIKFDNKIKSINEDGVYEVDKFVEKPNVENAEKYVRSGKYSWNSGMFVWTTETILNNIKKLMLNMYNGLERIQNSIDTENEENVLNEEYSLFESISIDYGIMEHAENIFVIPGDFGWDDVGSWTALERINETDEFGNVVKGNIVSVDTKGCIIEGTDKLLAMVGVEDLVVVDTADATLICSKEKCQEIKSLLKEIKEKNKENYL